MPLVSFADVCGHWKHTLVILSHSLVPWYLFLSTKLFFFSHSSPFQLPFLSALIAHPISLSYYHSLLQYFFIIFLLLSLFSLVVVFHLISPLPLERVSTMCLWSIKRPLLSSQVFLPPSILITYIPLLSHLSLLDFPHRRFHSSSNCYTLSLVRCTRRDVPWIPPHHFHIYWPHHCR